MKKQKTSTLLTISNRAMVAGAIFVFFASIFGWDDWIAVQLGIGTGFVWGVLKLYFANKIV